MNTKAFVLMEIISDWTYTPETGSVEIYTWEPTCVFLSEETRDSYLCTRDGSHSDIKIIEVEIIE